MDLPVDEIQFDSNRISIQMKCREEFSSHPFVSWRSTKTKATWFMSNILDTKEQGAGSLGIRS
jgi:hypothetical protein